MLENKVATGLKISAALIALAIVHGLGNFLGNIFLLSDIFTVVGAIGFYRFLTDSYIRDEVAETLSDAIDLDETASFLVAKGVEFAGNLGIAAADGISVDDFFGEDSVFFLNVDEDGEATVVQEEDEEELVREEF